VNGYRQSNGLSDREGIYLARDRMKLAITIGAIALLLAIVLAVRSFVGLAKSTGRLIGWAIVAGALGAAYLYYHQRPEGQETPALPRVQVLSPGQDG
jgi:peptidoglycan biosynthesis protein MviN/MurJ (putative lipid II flippase)